VDERCLRFDGLPADAEISAVPFNFHGEAGALVFARDITERKRAEQLIRAQREQLEAQNEQLLAQNEELTVQGNNLAEAEAELRAGNAELERRVAARTAELSARTRELSLANGALVRAARTKDEFLASMSHELRTPLTGILGLAEVLRMGIQGPLTEKQLNSLGLIEESGQHLLALINDILDVAKVEAGKMELELRPVMVAEVCQASVQFVKEMAAKKQLRLIVDRDMGVTTLQADARRLKQMLVNLLSNAVKFTPEGGQVGLEVRSEPAQQRVRFTVWDTGIGIAPDDLEKLFKPFVQLDSRLAREYSGTGLGLSLVMGLAELHGGSVAVESTPGKGSRFSILMPWTPAEETTPVPGRYPPPVVIPAAISQMLTVEDSPIAAEQLTQYLTELGIKNDVISQGGGAVERALAVRPDVILLDLLLPDISGWEVLKQLKADRRTTDIPVIIVSVVDERARADELGVAGYLVKPVAFSDLQEALSRGIRLAAQRAVAVPRATAPEAEAALTVLLAEDSEYVIASLVDALEFRDYRVAVARNGHEALKQARALRPDVILMDIQMPGLDGLEVTRRLRAEPNARLALVPIIALTALAMPGDRERCLAAGATEYLAKPVQIDQLLQLIQKLFGRPMGR
jgi:signal transduction histidine kinase/DNA-binding response OmpR family regulator